MTLHIPSDLLPADGRFGSGPARIRDAAIDSLAGPGRHVLGTSHRQAPVRSLVGRIQESLTSLYDLPDGYEVVLGNGGATFFWDIAVSSLIEQRSSHAVNGEFSSKFAKAAQQAPHLSDPLIRETPAGQAILPTEDDSADVYAWAHNETSTGALSEVRRIGAPEALTVVDGTSAAGGVTLEVSATDVYYFAPQKCFASDGGLWLALCSPAAVQRAERIAHSDRWIPESLSLQAAITNSRLQQTLNTPAIATLWLLAEQLDWMLEIGGLSACAERSARSSSILYEWATASPVAQPFVGEPYRSPVVVTIDFADSIDAAQIATTLRANGIVDTEPYRKLGRNQLRIGTYPTVDPHDVEALSEAITWIVEQSSPHTHP